MKAVFCAALFAIFARVLSAEDCNAIFEARKSEILFEIDRLDKSKGELNALGDATAKVLGAKENALKVREEKIAADLKALEEQAAKIEATLKANEAVLSQLSEVKEGKLTSQYTGMKASYAGEIMNALDPYLAAEILSRLDSKAAAGVLARIEPANAATITGILHKGAPFVRDQNATSNAN
jgi:flagellar motility protein MotE (MotC chaperone)